MVTGIHVAKNADLDPQLSLKLHRALVAEKEELFQVIEDPSMEVLQAALKNPLLDENHLLTMLKRRDLSEDLLKKIHKTRNMTESHPLKVAMAYNPNTPGALLIALLPHLHLFELVAVCYLPGVTPDQKVGAERAIIQRLPQTPLGNKLTLAHRGTAAIVEALLKGGDSRLMDACLDNPQLKEAAVFEFLNGPAATPEAISAVARHPRWKTRPGVRQALLKNRKTPLVWFTLFLPAIPVPELRNLLASQRLGHAQKKAVQEELKHRGQRLSGHTTSG